MLLNHWNPLPFPHRRKCEAAVCQPIPRVLSCAENSCRFPIQLTTASNQPAFRAEYMAGSGNANGVGFLAELQERHSRNRTSRSVWSASSLLALSLVVRDSKAGASSTHQTLRATANA